MAGEAAIQNRKDDAEVRRSLAFEAWNRFKDEVKDRYQIDQAIEDFANVRLDGRPGGDRKGLCPFHNDTNPSMNVRPQHGYFRCHTAGCGAGGDIFKFISDYLNVPFKEAVLLAARRAGVEPPEGMGDGASSYSSAPRRPRAPTQMNPAKLFECDLAPAFQGIRVPKVGRFLPVWHPGSARSPEPSVKRYRAEMVHVYRDMRGVPKFVVLRCRHRDGDKYFMPIRVGQLPKDAPDNLVDDKENRLGWVVRGTTPGYRKPIYGMEDATRWIAKNGKKRILVVEGEKTCDAARRLIAQREDRDDWLVLSPMGGHNASLYADWSAFMDAAGPGGLDGVEFVVWPDADHIKTRPDGGEIDAQKLYATDTIGAFAVAMRKAGHNPLKVSFTRANPGYDREKGWDLADAEEEGWDGDAVVRAIEEEGTKLPVEKRFMDLDVELRDDGDPTPFEDGPEEDAYLTLAGLTEEEEAEMTEAALSDADPLLDILSTDEDEFFGAGDDAPAVGMSDDDELSDDGLDAFEELSEDDVVARELFGGGPEEIEEAVVVERQLGVADVVEGGEVDVLDDDDDGGVVQDRYDVALAAVYENTYLRPLGFRENAHYYLSLRSKEIIALTPTNMRRNNLLALAPLQFWIALFGEPNREGRMVVDWDMAVSALIQSALQSGYYDPKKEAGQGARIDQGRVVFNTGDRLWIQDAPDGDGVISDLAEFQGDYHYTMGDSCGLPNFENCFAAGDEEPRKLLELITKLDWRHGTARGSTLAMFGWLCIGPICGVLPWRPHLWLDGQRAAGKSWIIENIVKPTLGSYTILVKSNSTESGLRNLLHSRAFPLVFDEAEGEMDGDRNRMAAVLRLARHAATPGESVVAQGVSGGAGLKHYSVNSTFLLASITPQLEASADKTRFARAKLGPGHKTQYFMREIEEPASKLLTPDFSARMIGRMVKRAGAIRAVQQVMVRAFASCGIERRLADVWGTFAAGAWCLLEDGVPEDFEEALLWLEDTFSISEEILETAAEISEDKDHSRLFRSMMAHEIRCETIELGVRTFNLGSIISMALDERDTRGEVMSMAQARKRLAEIGIRVGHKGKVAKAGQKVDCLLIHKNSPRIQEILSRTPYATSYADVIQQAEKVENGPSVRFGGLGVYRSVNVPIGHFPVSEVEDEDGDQGEDGGS